MLFLLVFACIDDRMLADKLDQDGDGYDSIESGGTDCDDSNPSINPGVLEQCDEVDNDCDGLVDNNPSDGSTWHIDEDGDGVGSTQIEACSQPNNGVMVGGDCDDTNAARRPGADESCNDLDDDCDDAVDEGLTTQPWFLDSDADGFGDPEDSTDRCGPIVGRVLNGDDCDDSNESINPDATEQFYDGVDQDCSGTSDHDADGDGSDAKTSGGDDCDDTNININPNETEICHNGVDEDCVDDDSECQHPGAVELAAAAIRSWSHTGIYARGITRGPPLQSGEQSFFTWSHDWTRWRVASDLSTVATVAEGGHNYFTRVEWSETFGSYALAQASGNYCWLDVSTDNPTEVGCAVNESQNSTEPSHFGVGGTRLIKTTDNEIYRIHPTTTGALQSDHSVITVAPPDGHPFAVVEWQGSEEPIMLSSGQSGPQATLWTSTGPTFDEWSPGPLLPNNHGLEMIRSTSSLSGDGDADILLATSYWSDLNVSLLSSPTSPSDLSTPWWPLTFGENLTVNLTILDFNGDGHPDIAIWPGERQPVSIALGPFSPFTPPTVYAELSVPLHTYDISLTSIPSGTQDLLLAAAHNEDGTTFYLIPFGSQ